MSAYVRTSRFVQKGRMVSSSRIGFQRGGAKVMAIATGRATTRQMSVVSAANQKDFPKIRR